MRKNKGKKGKSIEKKLSYLIGAVISAVLAYKIGAGNIIIEHQPLKEAGLFLIVIFMFLVFAYLFLEEGRRNKGYYDNKVERREIKYNILFRRRKDVDDIKMEVPLEEAIEFVTTPTHRNFILYKGGEVIVYNIENGEVVYAEEV